MVPFNSVNTLREEVAAASAAYVYNCLPSIMMEEPREAFRRLAVHFEAALRAYDDGRRGWTPFGLEPSEN